MLQIKNATQSKLVRANSFQRKGMEEIRRHRGERGTAKTQLSQILQQVEAGEPINANPKGLKPSVAMRGQISIRDDFDLPLDDLFDGSHEPGAAGHPPA